MNNGINLQNCTIQPVNHQISRDKDIQWDVLRLDRVHPVVSGNKYFKLRYFLKRAREEGKTGILTFGGAFSNHIHASAWAARSAGLKSVGIIRGEGGDSPTLRDAADWGMELRFTDRQNYRALSRPAENDGLREFPDYLVVPEGGYGREGMLGAAEILNFAGIGAYDYLVCAAGTGTMLAGLLYGSADRQHCIGVSVLKNHHSLQKEISDLLPPGKIQMENKLTLIHGYHFGGYARKDAKLLSFMNRFFLSTSVPTDFVYTAKMMYAVNEWIAAGNFKHGSRILTIHSGGLQGNRTLKPGMVDF